MFCKQYCIVYIEDAQKRQKRYAHAYKLKHKIQYTVCKTVLIAQTAKELGQTQDCASNSCVSLKDRYSRQETITSVQLIRDVRLHT